MSDNKVFCADLARSVRLFRAFRTEQSTPQAYYTAYTAYTALAQDTILQLSQYAALDGRVVIDVGARLASIVRTAAR